MPFVTERWSGGMLTNFATVRKAVKKMSNIDKMATDGTFDNISKRERLQITRQREKLEKTLGSISDLTRIPSAIFIVDINKEHIAVAEAKKLGIVTFAMVDTNSNPNEVDYAIPANDDATRSIEKITSYMVEAVKEGLAERKTDKDKADKEKEAEAKAKAEAKEAKAEAKAETAEEAPAAAPVENKEEK